MEGRTVGFATVPVSDLHRSPTYSTYAKVCFPDHPEFRSTGWGTINGGETCLWGVGRTVSSARKNGGEKGEYFVEGMAALGNYVWFLPREPEAEAEGFEADGADGGLCFFIRGVPRGHAWHVIGIVSGKREGTRGV